MSLLYKIFGFPMNMEEIIDKTNKNILNVFVRRKQGNSLVPLNFPYKYSVGIEVGKVKLTLWRSNEIWLRYHPEFDGLSSSTRFICFAKSL